MNTIFVLCTKGSMQNGVARVTAMETTSRPAIPSNESGECFPGCSPRDMYGFHCNLGAWHEGMLGCCTPDTAPHIFHKSKMDLHDGLALMHLASAIAALPMAISMDSLTPRDLAIFHSDKVDMHHNFADGYPYDSEEWNAHSRAANAHHDLAMEYGEQGKEDK